MRMKILELFLILFPVDYIKDILISDMENILKHPMDPGEFIWLIGCSFYIGCWAVILNRSNWWSISAPTMSGGAPLRLNKYMSRTRSDGMVAVAMSRVGV